VIKVNSFAQIIRALSPTKEANKAPKPHNSTAPPASQLEASDALVHNSTAPPASQLEASDALVVVDNHDKYIEDAMRS